MDELYGMQIIFQQSYLKIETKFLSLQKSEAYYGQNTSKGTQYH